MKYKIIIIVLAIIVSSLSSANEIKSLKIGQATPSFSLKNLETGEKESLENYKEKVLLINFWASWCIECVKEMPSLEQLYKSLKKHGFEVLGISTDLDEENVVYFLKEHPVSFPILLDLDNAVGLNYKLKFIPISFLLDKKHKIQNIFYGSKEWDKKEIRRLIEKLL
ncbi:MAG TPA: TlpA disulfide reductase family protein [Nitrospinota bacterium]|jgi:peroxiredoxin|nr:TlpA disulfide reductase family protein [Nitrospinota bacterium]|tara:strand:- start:328 stop:828 length:501 start_codon:yes stop_codon:yes gene_type:complete